MALLNTYSRGFTIVELLVVLSIAIALLSLGFLISFDSYRSYLFRSEREVIISVLQRTRSQSINNINGVTHGACYDAPRHTYQIFEGNIYSSGAATNEAVTGSKAVTLSGFPLCSAPGAIVFAQLIGTTSSTTITISQDNRTATISISSSGRINW